MKRIGLVLGLTLSAALSLCTLSVLIRYSPSPAQPSAPAVARLPVTGIVALRRTAKAVDRTTRTAR